MLERNRSDPRPRREFRADRLPRIFRPATFFGLAPAATMSTPPPFVQLIDHGIQVIDTGFHRPLFDASYLIVERGRAAFVDCGTNHSVPRLLAALAGCGLPVEAVDYVIATHVHLDHAGGAGLLMQQLPAATLVVHPLGAPHLIDPARLMASARGVYGDEEVARSYGELVPVAPQRVLRTEDGMTIDFAGRPLTFLDTPGHARHHHCIWDERSRGFSPAIPSGCRTANSTPPPAPG